MSNIHSIGSIQNLRLQRDLPWYENMWGYYFIYLERMQVPFRQLWSIKKTTPSNAAPDREEIFESQTWVHLFTQCWSHHQI